MKKKLLFPITAALLALSGAMADSGAPDGLAYRAGFSSMLKLGRDMYAFLKPEAKELISSQPISIATDQVPFARMLFEPEEPKPARGVWISEGFIDLVNRIAHAKAIDRIQKGYFTKYIDSLAQEDGEKLLKPLPNDSNPAFWSDDMLNQQLSDFNSIVGIVVGVKLAHHYLGHFDKYKDKLMGDSQNPVPINSLITPAEWDAAFAKGVRNALDAGCTVEGVITFYEAFDRMKTRPKWAAYFLPDFAKVAKMKKDMDRIQRKFFAGEDHE